MAVGFVAVSGLVLATPAPHLETPVVASGPIGQALSGPGGAYVRPVGNSPWVGPGSASAQTVSQTPARVGAPGLHVVATPQADSSLTMSETATFASLQTTVRLTPPSLAAAGKRFGHLSPVVKKVLIYADGRLVMTLPSLSRATNVDLTRFAHAGVNKVLVTYVLSGALSEVATGSALQMTALHPLMSSATEQLSVSYTVGGDTSTSSIVCPELPIFNQACGKDSGVLSGLPSGQSLIVITLGQPVITLGPPVLTLDPPVASASSAPADTQGSTATPDPLATTPATATQTTAGSTPDPVVPPTTQSTVEATSPTSAPAPITPPPTSATEPGPTDPASPTSDPSTSPTADPTVPPSDPPPSDPPPSDPTTPAPTTTTPPIGTEKMPNVAQAAPLGSELRTVESTTTPSTTPTVTPSDVAQVPTTAPTVQPTGQAVLSPTVTALSQ
ncbi:MAG: hypothetical protein M3Y71_11775 [Actinomycetota bacterium]|nr:hypothetical protein [Actinomycetota bacterium]